MSDIEETAKMVDQKMSEAARQARREHQTEWNEFKKIPVMDWAVSEGTYTVPQTDTKAMMKAREEWLEKTQHMRVVALNEACEIAKTHMGYGDAMSAQEITAMAHMFASFLIDGKS
jgi:hypothetical protein